MGAILPLDIPPHHILRRISDIRELQELMTDIKCAQSGTLWDFIIPIFDPAFIFFCICSGHVIMAFCSFRTQPQPATPEEQHHTQAHIHTSDLKEWIIAL